MTWVAPKTFTANSTLTAADLNTYLRDNSMETVPAIATTPGALYVSDGLNSVAERIPAGTWTAASEATSSTSYTNLATTGPAVTVTTGTRALISLYANLSNTSAVGTFMSYSVNGATPDDSTALLTQHVGGQRVSATILQTGLTAGSNTFIAKYKVTSGTGTYVDRRLSVIPL
jgi:hypothetical protein